MQKPGYKILLADSIIKINNRLNRVQAKRQRAQVNTKNFNKKNIAFNAEEAKAKKDMCDLLTFAISTNGVRIDPWNTFIKSSNNHMFKRIDYSIKHTDIRLVYMINTNKADTKHGGFYSPSLNDNVKAYVRVENISNQENIVDITAEPTINRLLTTINKSRYL